MPQQPTIQLDRNQEIQSVTVSSPQVRQVTTALTQEPQVTIQETRGTQTEATFTTQEEAVRPEAPNTVEPQGGSIGERQDRENNERAARNREIRSALGLGEVSPFDEPPEIVPSETVPIGEKQDRENNERAKRDREIRSNLGLGNESPLDKYEGVSFGKRQDAELSERRERDKEIRRNLGLGEISPFDEETDVAKGFKAAEERSRQKRESDPNFDRESDVRQRGERYSDFRERQEALKQERAEKVEAIKEKAELSKRLKEGGIAETPSGMVPVALTRADGQKKILAYLASEFVGVVEGVESGERATSLPSEDSYYESGGSSCIGLALYTKNSQVWIGSGTVAGYLPLGFNPKEGKNIANGGQGEVWAEVNIDQITGEVVSTQVNGGSSTPSNTDTSFYIPLGYYIYNGNSATVTNYGCGSVLAVICRNWFSVEPPFYQVSLFR
jgi:hypothetical protein